jgi:hypothetical protein
MDKNKFPLTGRLFNTASPRLGTPTQRKARLQVGHPNATQGTSASWVPERTSATQMEGTSAHPQVWPPNAMQGTYASWVPKCNARRVRKMGAQTENSSATKTSWRMDKNKFWLGGRLFNMASPRLGAAMQQKARPQDMRSNTTHGTSVIWAHKRKTDPQRKCPHKGALGYNTSWRMDKNKFWLGGRLFNTASPRLGAPTQCKARLQDGRPNETQGTSASWAPQRNARHVHKLGTPTQCKACQQVGRPNARPQCKRKARPHVCKLGATMQCKARPQDGRPNAKLIRNENVHTREH